MVRKYVLYRRVSTKSQANSGLGLEAQNRDIGLFLDNYNGTPFEVLGTFTDVLSGADTHRPELAMAIELAKRSPQNCLCQSSIGSRAELAMSRL